MKNKVVTKAFVGIINEIHLSYDKLEKVLSDKRLTQSERKIIQCWYYLRKGLPQKILDTVSNIETSYDPLVDSQKKLLKGISLIWLGDLKQALVLIKDSVSELKDYEGIGNVYFLSVYNYFICSLNLKNEKELDQAFLLLNQIKTLDEKQKISVLTCQFHYYNFKNNFLETEKSIEALEPVKAKMNESIFMAYSTGKYIFYIKTEQFKKCYSILDQIKKRRSFYSRSNFLFMKSLLENYCEDKPIYAYERDFKDSPFLHWQLMVIKSLEEGKKAEAKTYWKKLELQMPHIYKPEFQYQGGKDIFNFCLKKHLHHEIDENLHLPEKKEDALLFILQSSKKPIPFETLHQMIWAKEIGSKNDIDKLKKLVSRLRKNKEVSIAYKKGCYFLSKKAS